MHTDIDEPVKRFAIDQRLQIIAHEHIGRRLAGFAVALYANRRLGADRGRVTYIGQKRQALILAGARHLEVERHKWRVIDNYSDLLDGGDEEVFVALFSQDGREQPHHFAPRDWRTKVEPSAIAFDANVQIAAKLGGPLMDGR